MARSESMLAYVKVLSELCSTNDMFLSCVEEIDGTIDAMWTDDSLRDFLCTPAIKKEVREKCIRAVLEKIGASTEWINLFILMIRKGRMAQLPIFRKELRLFADKRCGIIRGVAQSAVALNDETKDKVRTFLKTELKSEVALSYKVNPKLLAGLKVSMGDVILDASLEWKLKEAKSKLIKKRA
jgi:F-type H+-transporting ATPase subunit delta